MNRAHSRRNITRQTANQYYFINSGQLHSGFYRSLKENSVYTPMPRDQGG
ncbi:hypothetical protein ECRM12761_18790 [Escherichia coli O145:H28 str. RM12761]|uniref:Uncharacterized protein n=1 Tax=Escherichia coli O145:H28 (strain RM12581) TaxID=1248823 RepID=A0ABC7ZXD0_ECOLR|nr:hypothetical protein ECRM13514_4041 [Escherichia coli O145:H28 str. RM13514]AHG16472.1 hypothetical protein ECRM13516_3844 [Escherichia coli O145:H28 str. RM13516]AHY66795.1 hypothetical protein ECRM12761_18790 [Escherichia coli O145:H28 str. RM12761]AHY72518.1 hypothetical protein ECRM12581_19940 [Escherichia coli O145:H28 str. RM12581]ESA65458.1 hypothetical protein HMPREF1589_04083 [Escherichia coli 113290]